VQVHIYGHNNTVSLQQSGEGGTNTSLMASGDGVASIVGPQTVHGDSAATIGSQSVRGDNNTIVGRDRTEAKETAKANWWTETRKRGVAITIATLIAAFAAVATWLEWTPWSP
jgi:hypothetical protein